MRIIEVITEAGHQDTIRSLAEQHGTEDIWCGAPMSDGRQAFRLLVSDEKRQKMLDSLQQLLGNSPASRIVIQPVDVVLPKPGPAESERKPDRQSTTREELFHRVEQGARLDRNFITLTVLSTVVAAVGLMENNVAVLIGAMVIAPLLGPNMALALASSLGDMPLMKKALLTSSVGIALVAALGVLSGLVWEVNPEGPEILNRTIVGMDSVVLALASGAAAALSLTTGLSSALVGVMVAVALLPPTVTAGMLVGAGHHDAAIGAALLLAVNIVCVILASKIVFLSKGIRPRTWLEQRKAQQSRWLYGLFWAILLIFLVVLIVLRGQQDLV